jgi:haloacid dehalogenase superfamily, subfamily IA, variant 3 with third motif having DD or ED/haloacid dehalogenase superfamily, subfamily IA, variant 1 with third motif having Dx(3-4)D or Dx(3-4)E
MNLSVIFDMDGVIIDSNQQHKKSWQMFCEKYNMTISENEFDDKIFGRTSAESLNFLFKTELPDDLLYSYSQEINLNFRIIAENSLVPLKGLKNFLNALVGNNIKFAMATSAPPENVELTLKQTGLTDYFKYIVDDTNVKNGKPHPEVFLNAAKLLNAPSNRCVVIEDSFAGIAAAKAAGMKVVGVTTTHKPDKLSETDFIIDDFDDLSVEILKDLITE